MYVLFILTTTYLNNYTINWWFYKATRPAMPPEGYKPTTQYMSWPWITPDSRDGHHDQNCLSTSKCLYLNSLCDENHLGTSKCLYLDSLCDENHLGTSKCLYLDSLCDENHLGTRKCLYLDSLCDENHLGTRKCLYLDSLRVMWPQSYIHLWHALKPTIYCLSEHQDSWYYSSPSPIRSCSGYRASVQQPFIHIDSQQCVTSISHLINLFFVNK